MCAKRSVASESILRIAAAASAPHRTVPAGMRSCSLAPYPRMPPPPAFPSAAGSRARAGSQTAQPRGQRFCASLREHPVRRIGVSRSAYLLSLGKARRSCHSISSRSMPSPRRQTAARARANRTCRENQHPAEVWSPAVRRSGGERLKSARAPASLNDRYPFASVVKHSGPSLKQRSPFSTKSISYPHVSAKACRLLRLLYGPRQPMSNAQKARAQAVFTTRAHACQKSALRHFFELG
jgi:hypothetical protein